MKWSGFSEKSVILFGHLVKHYFSHLQIPRFKCCRFQHHIKNLHLIVIFTVSNRISLVIAFFSKYNVMGWQNRLKFIGKTNWLKISLQNAYFYYFG